MCMCVYYVYLAFLNELQGQEAACKRIFRPTQPLQSVTYIHSKQGLKEQLDVNHTWTNSCTQLEVTLAHVNQDVILFGIHVIVLM